MRRRRTVRGFRNARRIAVDKWGRLFALISLRICRHDDLLARVPPRPDLLLPAVVQGAVVVHHHLLRPLHGHRQPRGRRRRRRVVVRVPVAVEAVVGVLELLLVVLLLHPDCGGSCRRGSDPGRRVSH